ncbi:MAG: protein kinase [Dermatophilaceae bacterium]
MDTARPLGSSYTLERPLGQGASGQVWFGHDATGQERAFKLLRPELARDAAVVQRFVQERGVLASIHHPHVVQVHDLVVEGDTLAIVMDYVNGQDLGSDLRTHGPKAPADVARLGHQVAAALSAAHAAGVVHRDVKPENVLLDPVNGAAKLTDFGIAKILDGSQQTTMMLGTPSYMAPEIAEGHDPTPAADVYSLGVMLYELCCAVTPFAGRPSTMATLWAHQGEVPGRPVGVPDPLWELLAQMLAKDPTHRPSAAVLTDVLGGLAHSLVGAPPAPAASSPPPTVAIAAADVTLLSQPGGAATTRNTPTQYASPVGGPPPYPYGPPMGGPPMGGPPMGASPVGGYPTPYGMTAPFPPAPAQAPRRKNNTALIVGALVALLGIGAAVTIYLSTSRDTAPAAATAQPSASPPATVTQTVTGTPAPAQTPASTPAPTQTPASTPAPTPAAQVIAPSQGEADGTVMTYDRTFRTGTLSQSDMGRLFTPTVQWYGAAVSRSDLYGRLQRTDVAQHNQTYSEPLFRSFVGPTTYGAQPASTISYTVSYTKPSDTGSVLVTYTLVKGADDVSRIAAVTER